MSEFPAHALTEIINCKIDGCEAEAITARGRYAKLCEDHRAIAAKDQARVRRGGPSRSELAAADRPSVKRAAKRLVPAAAELDKALARRHIAREQARVAFAAFKQALDELHETAKQAIA